MEGPRSRIVQLLQQRGHASVDQLAREVGLATATVRRHLDILQRDQLVAYDEVRKKTGRPEYAFYLTEHGQEAMPKGYDRLLDGLLQNLAALPHGKTSSSGEELLQSLLERVALQTAEGYQQETGDGPPGTRQALALKVLEQEGFSPEMEAKNGSTYLWLSNCPFRRVAMANSAVCSYDKALISALLGSEASQVQCIRDGDSRCCYVTSNVKDGS